MRNRVHRTLRVIDLTNTDISSDGLWHLTGALSNSSSLCTVETLTLDNNPVGCSLSLIIIGNVTSSSALLLHMHACMAFVDVCASLGPRAGGTWQG